MVNQDVELAGRLIDLHRLADWGKRVIDKYGKPIAAIGLAMLIPGVGSFIAQ